jgi:hypothetical protein
MTEHREPPRRSEYVPTAEQVEAYLRFAENRPLVPAILIRDPNDHEVLRWPKNWRPLDELVAEKGTRFEWLDMTFDITDDVEGELGRGRVAKLVAKDPTIPREPSPEERAVFGIPTRPPTSM